VHGANDQDGKTEPKTQLIIVARRSKYRGGQTMPVMIEWWGSIAIITILEVGVEDRDRGHLIAVV